MHVRRGNPAQGPSQNRGAPGAADFWDEHALHEQRDTNILCWLYGYDPHEFARIPARFPVSVDRLERRGWEYQQITSAWESLLAPYSSTWPGAEGAPGAAVGSGRG